MEGNAAGWFFGAQRGLLTAGPAVVISWVVGGLAILVLALVHAELGAMFPVSVGAARFLRYLVPEEDTVR